MKCSLVFDQPVHLVEERRHLLDLVEDDRSVSRIGGFSKEFLFQQPGAFDQVKVQLRVEEIVDDAFRVPFSQKGRFPHLSRTPEKGRLPGRKIEIKEAGDYFHFRNSLRNSLTISE